MECQKISKYVSIQPVEMTTHPIRHAHIPQTPNPVAQYLDDRLHSKQVIRTIDILTFADDSQIMRRYVLDNAQAYRLFIQLMGQHFQRSPSQRKTEIPLMILSQTESVFMRRIRRLKHIQKQQFSSHTGSGTSISFSKSYIPNNNSGNYLQSHLSQKSLSQITQFRNSNYCPPHQHDIYCPSSDQDPQHQLKFIKKKSEEQFNSWLMLSGIRRLGPLEEKDNKLINQIRQVKEQQIMHLIVGSPKVSLNSHVQKPQTQKRQEIQNSDKQITVKNDKSSKSFISERINQRLLSPLGYLVGKEIPLNIKKLVYKQLSLYSWKGLSPSVPQNYPRKKVRDKALNLLQQMGHFIQPTN